MDDGLPHHAVEGERGAGLQAEPRGGHRLDRGDERRRDALLQPETREAYATLLAQGWTDTLRELYPDEPMFTFWDYFRQHWERDAGLRIDHLLPNPALWPRVRAAGVDRWVRGLEKASDHAPTWIDLDR